MEVLRVRCDGLLPPLQPCRQEPREGQDYPPQRRRHAEEVDEQEDDGADGGAGGGVAHHAPAARLARHALVADDEANDVADRHHEVAGGQKDDGPLGVLEAFCVHEEGADGHRGRDAAQNGPQPDPESGERALLLAEVGAVATDGTIVDAACDDLVVVTVRAFVHRYQRRPALAPAVLLCRRCGR